MTAEMRSSAMSTMTPLASRIEAMYSRDRIWAIAFVVALWAVLALILFQVNAVLDDNTVRIVSWIAGLVVALFNTASMVALVRHYAEDKEYIYGLDIRHLDDARSHKA